MIIDSDPIFIDSFSDLETRAVFEYDVSVDLSSRTSLWSLHDPLDWINKPKAVLPVADIGFNWAPVDAPYSYPVGDTVIVPAVIDPDADPLTYRTDSTYYLTHINGTGSGLTFTATANLHGLNAVKFEWDFGDGTQGVGQTVKHSYKVANKFAKVTLKVIDELSHEYHTVRQIYLIP